MLLERYLNEEPISRAEIEKVIAACTAKRELFSRTLWRGQEHDRNGGNAGEDCGLVSRCECRRLTSTLRCGVQARPRSETRADRRRSSLCRDDSKTEILSGTSRLIATRRLRRSRNPFSIDMRTQASSPPATSVFFCGMPEAKIGDVLGDPGPIPGSCELGEPLLSVQAIPEDVADHSRLAGALQQLSSEDPHLNFTWFEDERELHVKIMGAVSGGDSEGDARYALWQSKRGSTTRWSSTRRHLLRSDTALSVTRCRKPCWAIVKYRMEPGEPGKRCCLFRHRSASTTSRHDIQKEIERSIEGRAQAGKSRDGKSRI